MNILGKSNALLLSPRNGLVEPGGVVHRASWIAPFCYIWACAPDRWADASDEEMYRMLDDLIDAPVTCIACLGAP